MILEGEADHRDQYYSEEEKASQQSMLICCSRAKGSQVPQTPSRHRHSTFAALLFSITCKMVMSCGTVNSRNEAVKAAAERHQVPASQLHFEQFIVEDKGGEAFTLVLARSRRRLSPPR
jgi:ferredoxin-NADP reductase